MPVAVDDIINKPFSFRTRDDKLRIIAEGKPSPHLKMAPFMQVKSETEGGSLKTHQFSPSMYDDVQWLTGCEKRNAFFCWPCLLFKPPLGLWNSTGVTELSYLIEGIPRHEEAVEHIAATLQLQKSLEVAESFSVDVEQFNDLVKRNRQILKRLVDVICNLLTKQSSHQRRNGCQLDPEDCVRNLLFLRTYDTLNCNYIEDALDLLKISPKIVNDLVDTMAKLIKMSVRDEVLMSTYVSLILSDHSKVGNKSQVSTVLRYIKDGKVFERFIGFVNMADQRTASIIHHHISNTIVEFGISEKLVALSLDGGILPTGELIELNRVFSNTYPNAFFAPWYCHNVESVLIQSLTKVNECSVFLKALSEMKLYFNKKSKRYQSLEFFMANLDINIKNAKWFRSQTQFTQGIKMNRKDFIRFFEWMLQNSIAWDADDITKALSFQQILDEFKTVFLLKVLSKVLDIVSPLTKLFKSSVFENLSKIATTVGLEIVQALTNERDRRFQATYENAQNEVRLELPGPVPKRIKTDPDDPLIQIYTNLYKSIFDCAIQNIRVRYLKLAKLKFCELLICDSSGNFSFSSANIGDLVSACGTVFVKEQVKNELIVLRTNGKVFHKKSVYELYEFFINMKLKYGFRNLFKLCELILTLPIGRPSEEVGGYKIDDFKDWSYIPEGIGTESGDVSILCTELEYLQELKKSSTFHKHAAEVFYEVNKTLELLPK